jgi:hypothetical protein
LHHPAAPAGVRPASRRCRACCRGYSSSICARMVSIGGTRRGRGVGSPS